MLQRVEADEPGIGRQQRMLLTAVLRSLPGELHRIHEHKARVCLGAGRIERDRLRREADDVRECRGVQRDRRW
ncbi:hypothetical protein D3C83_42000 [compost metagenome]